MPSEIEEEDVSKVARSKKRTLPDDLEEDDDVQNVFHNMKED